MLKHYWHIAWRQWHSSSTFALLNLVGLAAGLTVALLIGLWISDEVFFDHYFPSHGCIVKVMTTQPTAAGLVTTDHLPPALIGELRTNHGRFFRHLALVWPNFPHVLAAGERQITASGQWAEPEWPEILALHMICGSRKSLGDPSSVLIDRTTALALFGDSKGTDAMGRTIRVDNAIDVKIAGVYEDLPDNTSFAGTHVLLAWKKASEEMPWFRDAMNDWGTVGFWIFGELNDPGVATAASADIAGIFRGRSKDAKETLSLYPMDRWHLYSEFDNGVSSTGRVRLVLLFAFIGLFVLLLASINFMNLATARSERHARVVGIRKTLGASRLQLVAQFLTESVLLSMLGLIIAIGVAQLSLPLFNRLAAKDLALPYAQPLFWLVSVGFALLTGLFSGIYPAFYLSRFRPAFTLRMAGSLGAHYTRRALTILQFTISAGLIVATAVVYRQVAYARGRPAGYERDGLFFVDMETTDIYSAPYDVFREELLRSGAVADMAESSDATTGKPELSTESISWPGKDPSTKPQLVHIDVTHDFGRTIGWTMIAGRDFSRVYHTDSNAVLLNESAGRLIGWRDPIGRFIRIGDQDCRVIGVVRNMVMGSPYDPVPATLISLDYKFVNYITIRLNPAISPGVAINRIRAVFKRFDPHAPFEFAYLADDY